MKTSFKETTSLLTLCMNLKLYTTSGWSLAFILSIRVFTYSPILVQKHFELDLLHAMHSGLWRQPLETLAVKYDKIVTCMPISPSRQFFGLKSIHSMLATL